MRRASSGGSKEGDKVCSADDADLGKVVAFVPDMIRPTHLVVEKGVLRKHDLFVPVGAVSNYDGGTIYLDASKDAAEAWATPPPTTAGGTTSDQPW
jgi:hypothetical protein